MKYANMEDRLLSNSVLDVETGCWIWIAKRNPKGYGEMKVWNAVRALCAKRYAHRIAYEVLKGVHPGIYEVDHVCGQPSCINPDHLQLVSKSDNCRLRWSRA